MEELNRVYSTKEHLELAIEFATYQADAEDRLEKYRLYIIALEDENRRLQAEIKKIIGNG